MEKALSVVVKARQAEVAGEDTAEVAGRATVVKGITRAGAGKVVLAVIPIGPGRLGEFGAQMAAIPGGKLPVPAVAEDLEKRLKIETADAGELELEQGVLTEIHIHRMDAARAVEGVVEGVAPGGSDHDQIVLGGEAHDLAIEPGVFPAGIIHQAVTMDAGENPPRDGGGNRVDRPLPRRGAGSRGDRRQTGSEGIWVRIGGEGGRSHGHKGRLMLLQSLRQPWENNV